MPLWTTLGVLVDAHYPLQIAVAKELPFHHRKVGQGEVLLLHLAAEVLDQELWNPLCLPFVSDHEMESSASPLPRHCGVPPGVADSVLP